MVQWIILNVPNVGANPGQGTRSHMLQPRPGAAIKENMFEKLTYTVTHSRLFVHR